MTSVRVKAMLVLILPRSTLLSSQEVAKLKVKQEKARYIQQQRLDEAARQLKFQQLEDEVTQLDLERRLRDLYTSRPCAREPGAKPKIVNHGAKKPKFNLDQSFADGACNTIGKFGLDRVVDRDQNNCGVDRQSLCHSSLFHPSDYSPEDHTQIGQKGNEHDEKPEKSESKKRGFSKSIFKSIAKPELREFLGTEVEYIDWRSYWDAFIDDSDEEVKDKMMLLKQAVKKGKAAPLVQNLGYSETQYRLALERLERKYGGTKRRLQRQLNEVLDFDPISRYDYVGMESFITKLGDILATVEENQPAETGVSTIYAVAIQKLPEDLVVSYQIHLREHGKEEGLRVLVDWFYDRVALQLEAQPFVKSPQRKVKLLFNQVKLTHILIMLTLNPLL